MAAILMMGAVGMIRGASPDVQAPTPPGGLTIVAKTATSVSLRWGSSSDDTGVVAYDIFRNGVPAGHSPSNSFTSTGLTENRSYVFRVKARDAAGNESEASNALLAMPQAAGQVQPVTVRTQFNAVVLNYDPYIWVSGSYVRAAHYYGFRNVDVLIEQYIELLKKASGGQVVWRVTNRFDLNEFPLPAASGQPALTASNYIELRSQGYDYWNNLPRGPAYAQILHDPRFGISEGVNAGEVDAVWVFGLAGTGFWETAMAGPTAYWVNGDPIMDYSMARNVVFYGFGKEGHQGVGFMCENTAHMTETIIRDKISVSWPRAVAARVFNTLDLEDPGRQLVTNAVNDWTHLTQAEATSWDPMLVAPGNSQCGLSHFPPTAVLSYDWGTPLFNFGNADDFRVYDGVWETVQHQFHVLSAIGAKVIGFCSSGRDRSRLPMAFSDADIELSLRVMNGESYSHAGFLFRVLTCQSGANRLKGYYVGLNAFEDKIILARVENSFTILASAAHTIETNVYYRLRLEAHGSSIKVFVDGSLVPALSFSDDAYITGAFGLCTYFTEAWFSGLEIMAHAPSNRADKWYNYPADSAPARDISTLEWNGDTALAMDNFYAWWWEHLPKNGGGHYATDLQNGSTGLVLNTWWPYVFDINQFATTCPGADIIFPAEDISPPTPPASVAGVALGASRIGLSWVGASDNVGVTRYGVFRNGALLRKTALPYVTDTRLSPNTAYTYVIKSFDGSGNVSAGSAEVTVHTLATEPPGLIVNGGFEVSPQVSGWSPESSCPNEVQFSWAPPGSGRNGTRAINITASSPNDAHWSQKVTGLQPGAAYWLSGWIKGEGIAREPGGSIGANLCLMGVWQWSPQVLSGTFDWRQASFCFVPPPSGTVTIGCRLGFWGSLASGSAWFDNVMITKASEIRLDMAEIKGGRFQFVLTAAPGPAYCIERSANLRDWTEAQTLSPMHPTTEWSEPILPGVSMRCYRAALDASAVTGGGNVWPAKRLGKQTLTPTIALPAQSALSPVDRSSSTKANRPPSAYAGKERVARVGEAVEFYGQGASPAFSSSGLPEE